MADHVEYIALLQPIRHLHALQPQVRHHLDHLPSPRLGWHRHAQLAHAQLRRRRGRRRRHGHLDLEPRALLAAGRDDRVEALWWELRREELDLHAWRHAGWHRDDDPLHPRRLEVRRLEREHPSAGYHPSAAQGDLVSPLGLVPTQHARRLPIELRLRLETHDHNGRAHRRRPIRRHACAGALATLPRPRLVSYLLLRLAPLPLRLLRRYTLLRLTLLRLTLLRLTLLERVESPA